MHYYTSLSLLALFAAATTAAPVNRNSVAVLETSDGTIQLVNVHHARSRSFGETKALNSKAVERTKLTSGIVDEAETAISRNLIKRDPDCDEDADTNDEEAPGAVRRRQIEGVVPTASTTTGELDALVAEAESLLAAREMVKRAPDCDEDADTDKGAAGVVGRRQLEGVVPDASATTGELDQLADEAESLVLGGSNKRAPDCD